MSRKLNFVITYQCNICKFCFFAQAWQRAVPIRLKIIPLQSKLFRHILIILVSVWYDPHTKVRLNWGYQNENNVFFNRLLFCIWFGLVFFRGSQSSSQSFEGFCKIKYLIFLVLNQIQATLSARRTLVTPPRPWGGETPGQGRVYSINRWGQYNIVNTFQT